MSFLVKGHQSWVLKREEPTYDAETGAYSFLRTYEGPPAAIIGLEADFQARGLSYQSTNDGPLYSVTVRIPIVNEIEERWEVSNEANSRSIWGFPTILNEAKAYDAGATGRNYRAECEAVALGNDTSAVAPATTNAAAVIRALKADTTGLQFDTCVLRRFRKMDFDTANSAANRISLDVGQKIFTTAQLNLPATVAFTLPEIPADQTFNDALDFMWGWRKRAQRVEIVGIWVEQQVELAFQPWSLLFYTPSTDNLIW